MWASSSELSSAWLEQHCGLKCDKCLVTDLSNKTAPRSCFLLSFSGGAQDEKRLVLKQLPSSEDGEPLPARLTLSRDLGLAREGFYGFFFFFFLCLTVGQRSSTSIWRLCLATWCPRCPTARATCKRGKKKLSWKT